MNNALEQKLIECLDALEHGRSVEQILARYPDDAAALRPMLETAVQLGQLKLAPSTAARNTSRKAFLAQAAAQQAAPGPVLWVNQVWRWLQRGLVPAMGVAAALLVGFLLLTNAAIPGQPLYGAKLQLEDWRLSLARDPETVRALTEEWEARRLAEVKQLLAANLEADVIFGEDIAAMASDHWILNSGIRLNITDQTVIIGEPEVGIYLHIEGRAANGAVTATLVHVDLVHSDLLQGTPTPTPVPATETPSPASADKGSAPAVAATPTPFVSPSPTATAAPVVTPTPSPTGTVPAAEPGAAAVQEDDGSSDHDYGDDHGGYDSSDDNSGSGSDEDDGDDGNSDSGSGEDDGGDDNSGSSSGDEDDGDDDNSGSGSGDDDGDEDNSGSGSN